MEMVIFRAARDGGVMTRYNGKVAFPERGDVRPQDGDEYEVISAKSNAKGNVFFLSLGRRISTKEERSSVSSSAESRWEEGQLQKIHVALLEELKGNENFDLIEVKRDEVVLRLPDGTIYQAAFSCWYDPAGIGEAQRAVRSAIESYERQSYAGSVEQMMEKSQQFLEERGVVVEVQHSFPPYLFLEKEGFHAQYSSMDIERAGGIQGIYEDFLRKKGEDDMYNFQWRMLLEKITALEVRVEILDRRGTTIQNSYGVGLGYIRYSESLDKIKEYVLRLEAHRAAVAEVESNPLDLSGNDPRVQTLPSGPFRLMPALLPVHYENEQKWRDADLLVERQDGRAVFRHEYTYVGSSHYVSPDERQEYDETYSKLVQNVLISLPVRGKPCIK